MPFHIKTTSYDSGETTYLWSSQPDRQAPITNLSLLTRPSGLVSEEDRQSYLLTTTSSHTFTQHFSSPMVFRQDLLDDKEMVTREQRLFQPISVKGSIVGMDVKAQQECAVSAMPVSNADSQGMGKKTALSKCEATYGMHPKYLHYNIWNAPDGGEENIHFESLQCLANWTEQVRPLLSVPVTKLGNAVVMRTIDSHPNLFKIVSPINIDCFKSLLASHPNCLFVKSVCKGLREGFWPWANTYHREYLSIVDKALDTPESGPEADFI
jgi:hypothetical protein